LGDDSRACGGSVLTVTDVPLVTGPIYGLRSWRVSGARGEECLVAPHRGARWPGGGLMEAHCSVTPAHDPPHPGCRCGLHAWHPTRRSARRACGYRREIPGILQAWGAVELHAEGFRAQRGRPYALVLLPRGNAALLERLAAAYEAQLLVLRDPRALAAYCRDQGFGMTDATVASLLA
jgi:hypothetical protein